MEDRKPGYGGNDILNGLRAVVRLKTCPYEYAKDNESECNCNYDQPHRLAKGTFYLPHSCDEWVIGTPEQARHLINDIMDLMIEEEIL